MPPKKKIEKKIEESKAPKFPKTLPLIIFKDGKEAGRVVGVTSKEEIAKKLDALLK